MFYNIDCRLSQFFRLLSPAFGLVSGLIFWWTVGEQNWQFRQADKQTGNSWDKVVERHHEMA